MTQALWLWRHPRAEDAAGLCIGHTDLRVDPRRAKRLAHRIRATARLRRLPHCIWTSPLERGHAVGRWLRRWGWQHRVDERLRELHFGQWEGQPWNRIAAQAVAAWEADFALHAVGGGESLQQLMRRAQAFLRDQPASALLVVGHAGWMQALAWSLTNPAPPSALEWPAPPLHGRLMQLVFSNDENHDEPA